MRNIYLKFPTIEDRENWLEYIKEYHLDKGAKPLGCTENIDYEDWLNKIKNEYIGIDLQEGRVPSSVYFLMIDNKIVGHLSIRHSIDNEFLKRYGGHIGYGVRPSERRKGYATIMLALALEKCRELGLEDVMVTCKEDNIGSFKTIENNGGVLKEIIFIPEENCNFRIYWINIEKVLSKNNMMKNIKYFVFILLVFSITFNVKAQTIVETTNDDNFDSIEPLSIIIGVTKFTPNEIITAAKAAKAGANDAALYMKSNNTIEGYETPTIYVYYGKIGGWYALDEDNNAEYITDQNLLNQLSNMNIYYVNNKEKVIELDFDYDIDESKLPKGVKVEDNKLKVNATSNEFAVYTTDDKRIDYVLNDNSEFVIDNSKCFVVSNGYITDYDSNCTFNVDIPSKINDVDIIGIRENAFNNKGIKEVSIPSSIMNIENNAFSNNNLEKVIINDKYDDSDFTLYGENVFGEFSDITYVNELSKILDQFPDELEINVYKDYEEIYHSRTDEVIDYKLTELVFQNNIDIRISGTSESNNELNYEVYEDDQGNPSTGYFKLTISKYFKDNGNMKKIEKDINYKINYIDGDQSVINSLNNLENEINRRFDLLKNEFVNGNYHTLLDYNAVNIDVMTEYGFNYYMSITSYGKGGMPFTISNTDDEIQVSKVGEELGYFISKNNVLYGRSPIYDYVAGYLPKISRDDYVNDDEFVDAAIQMFVEKTGITNYINLGEEYNEKYQKYTSYVNNDGLFTITYSILLQDLDSKNGWHIKLFDYKNITQECYNSYHDNTYEEICENLYAPGLSYDDYDNTIDYVKAGFEKFKNEMNIT